MWKWIKLLQDKTSNTFVIIAKKITKTSVYTHIHTHIYKYTYILD